MLLVGGQLLTGLAALGIRALDVTDVVCTHLHSDHGGWLFDLGADPVFTSATLWCGGADLDHYLGRGAGELATHIRAGFRTIDSGRLRLIREDTRIARGVAALLTPGHTLGSLSVEITSATERLLLVGDAITAPVQLAEPGWHFFGDVDAALADDT
jgi:glyoxylase-like metal-dependent hydrolase (beta-lactamase superfamily II)